MTKQLHRIFIAAFAMFALSTGYAPAPVSAAVQHVTEAETDGPNAEIGYEKIFTEDIVEINKSTELYKFTVTATGLTAPANIYLTGGADAFSISKAQIPAGTSVTEIILSINPATIGTHKGNIVFDFDAVNPELNYTRSFTIKAYDPDNLPSLKLSKTEVELTAKIGEKAETELAITPENCFDYIYAKAGSATTSGILIGSSMFLPTLGEQKFRVTFQPKTEGTVTQTFIFTTTKGEPVTLTVTGKATGNEPDEPKEGDELKLDDTRPQALYNQAFDGVEQNKPLAVDGWTNVAEKGTRAWWGYTGANGDIFNAAKATLYDSYIKDSEGQEASMLLISPALDYKNAADKHLVFNLMGQYLYEGQEVELSICLIEMIDGQPAIYPMNGFSIPATEDEAGQWIPYVVDMSVVENMPDPFFIGFRLQGKRGTESAPTYYINNFSWGDPEASISSTATSSAPAVSAVYSLQGVRILDAATPAALRTLSPGIYVSAGKKFVVK